MEDVETSVLLDKYVKKVHVDSYAHQHSAFVEISVLIFASIPNTVEAATKSVAQANGVNKINVNCVQDQPQPVDRLAKKRVVLSTAVTMHV